MSVALNRYAVAAAVLGLLLPACVPVDGAALRAQASQDGLYLVYEDEGSLMTDSGAPANYTSPDLYITMPNVMLAGMPVAGAPQGPVEEQQCAAACRATPPCNVFLWCPLEEGCAASLSSPGSSGGDRLAYRQCALLDQPNAQASQAHPPEAVQKGPSVGVTSGQIMPYVDPQLLPGYTIHMAKGFFNMYDYTCEGSLKPEVCMWQGTLEDAEKLCEAAGVKCLGIKLFTQGRDYLAGPIVFMKGIPDSPTPDNLPGVPINRSVANWNGNVIFHEKKLNDSELAEAQAFLPSSGGGASGLSSGAIAGIAVGAVAGLALVVAALLVVQRRYARSPPVHDAEQGSKARSSTGDTIAGIRTHPSRLTPGDLASMAHSSQTGSLGKSALGSAGIASLPTSATHSTNSRSSIELATVAGELGGEWLVDVSQLTFVMNENGQPTELGAGAQGVVYKALLRGTELVAAKVIAVGADPLALQAFMQEARMLRQLRHRNVLQFVGVAVHGDKAVVLTEFMEGRDLFSALSRKDATGKRDFSWYARGRKVAVDVAAALAYLHHTRVLHLDIKSSNVLLCGRDMGAKLGDVGVSRLLTHTHASMSGAVGTFAWCAPEVLLGKPSSVSFPADIYSMGILLWEICTGEVPLRGRLEMPRAEEQCPQGVIDLLLRCLSDVPAERPTAAQLHEEIAVLAGHSLGGSNGVLSGADGLERAMSPALPLSDDAIQGIPEAAAALPVPYDGRRLAGVEVLRCTPPPPSPFA